MIVCAWVYFLCSVFCSFDLCVCFRGSCCLCRQFGIWSLILQFCSLSQVLWLLCTSKQVSELLFLVLWKIRLVFWWELHCTIRLLSANGHFNINYSNLWTQYTFIFICVIRNFLINVLPLTSLVKCNPSYFVLFDIIINGIVFLISFW